MTIRRFRIRESYDWVYRDAVRPEAYEALLRYLDQTFPGEVIIERLYDKLRFINYVGFIYCEGVEYEIVPKVSLSVDDGEGALLSMLRYVEDMDIAFMERVEVGRRHTDSLMEAFLHAFVQRLLQELKRGVHRTYVSQTDNLLFLKGRLQVSEQLRAGARQSSYAICTFDEHNEDHDLNRMLLAALRVVQRVIQSKYIMEINQVNALLENVREVHPSSTNFKQVTLNRQNERFHDLSYFARMILDRAGWMQSGVDDTAFSMLFEMNKLFEAYVGQALVSLLGEDRVILQDTTKHLLINMKTGQGNILLKPDFVIDESILLDTKWKSCSYNDRVNYSQADIYQMYAYVTSYTYADRCLLLYPWQEDGIELPRWRLAEGDKTIEMHAVRVDTVEHTLEDLEVLLMM
ncbi:McrC family protein [Paenibacillus koleovorans]|uniref:McrC family protein n=1 Tax=Paenibacillus koleovorans TaxID=121608 RepID=UPI000FD894BD|nr:ATP-dependent helicase [Paenibacillus koleovorans]